ELNINKKNEISKIKNDKKVIEAKQNKAAATAEFLKDTIRELTNLYNSDTFTNYIKAVQKLALLTQEKIIYPVQRLPRHELFLRGLLKDSSKLEISDENAMKKALTYLQNSISQFDETLPLYKLILSGKDENGINTNISTLTKLVNDSLRTNKSFPEINDI